MNSTQKSITFIIHPIYLHYINIQEIMALAQTFSLQVNQTSLHFQSPQPKNKNQNSTYKLKNPRNPEKIITPHDRQQNLYRTKKINIGKKLKRRAYRRRCGETRHTPKHCEI